MKFSERKGLTSVRSSIQKEEMDEVLRNSLWNAFHLNILGKNEYTHYSNALNSSTLYTLFLLYWHDYFKKPIDEMPERYERIALHLRTYLLSCPWYEVYDFTEFTAQYAPEELRPEYTEWCNGILEKEQSAYRFVADQITEITSEEEIESIESAIDGSGSIGGVRTHLRSAVSLLSDRKSPDYRNSVKESISAVESLCKAISKKENATLHSALQEIEKVSGLHPALKKALSNLYGYTSDSSGIRHALLEESSITYSDAKFMLVSCSAFVNYILGKYAESNEKIGS